MQQKMYNSQQPYITALIVKDKKEIITPNWCQHSHKKVPLSLQPLIKCPGHSHKIGQTMADPPAINSKVKIKKITEVNE